MFINIKAYAGGSLVYEVNPYDAAAGTLKGLDYPYLGQGLPDPGSLGANEAYVDELVYEMKPSSNELTGEAKTFHFALATGRYKDNRIPPKGFDIGGTAERVSMPVVGGKDTPGLYTSAEYAGGYDEVSLTIPVTADTVEVNLYYQTTSREYIEFLRDEINGTGNLTLSGTGAGGDPAYIVQTDPFFAQLKAWGDTIWSLWTHNKDMDGAAPFLMAQATVGTPPPVCGAPIQNLLSATPGNQQIDLFWEADQTQVAGYKLYYDLAGKAQLIADIPDPATTTYTDVGLTNGQTFCYKVTSYDATCESQYSNILCAVPKDQQLNSVGVSQIITLPDAVFKSGDLVTFEVTVVDGDGVPVPGASVQLAITGPNPQTITTGASDGSGIATATWQTNKGKKSRGDYTVTVTGVTLENYVWDGLGTSTTFTVQ